MAHLSWDIPNRLIKPLKNAFDTRAGLGFGLELMKRDTDYVSPALKGDLRRRDGQGGWPLMCVTVMTAPHPHLLPWIALRSESERGDGTGKMIVRNKVEN